MVVAPGLLVPEVLNHFCVGLDARAEDENLEPVGTGSEGPGHAWTDADGIERLQLDDLVVELDTAAAVEDDVDLLGGAVAMRKRLALIGFDGQVVHARLLG